MDFRRPVEAVAPGATGRLLGALGRVETELPVTTLAQVAGVGRTRASRILAELSDLGAARGAIRHLRVPVPGVGTGVVAGWALDDHG